MKIFYSIIFGLLLFNFVYAREKIANYSISGTIIDEPKFYESDSKEMASYNFKILVSDNKEIFVRYYVRRVGVQLSDKVPKKGELFKETATFSKSDDAKSKILGWAEINNDIPVAELLKRKKSLNGSTSEAGHKLNDKFEQIETNLNAIKQIKTDLGDFDEIKKHLKDFENLMKDKENKRKIDIEYSKQVVFTVQLQLNEVKEKLGGKNGIEMSFSQTLAFYLPIKVVDIESMQFENLKTKAKNDMTAFISKNKEKNWLFEKRNLSTLNKKIELSLYALAPLKNHSMVLSDEVIQDLIKLNPGENVAPISKDAAKNKYDCIKSSNGDGTLCVFKVVSPNKTDFITFRQLKKDGAVYGLQVSALDQKYEKIALDLFFQTGGVVEELMSPTLAQQENLKKAMLKSMSESIKADDGPASKATKKAFELTENHEKNPSAKTKADLSNFAKDQYEYFSAKARQSYAKMKLVGIYTALKSFYIEWQDYTTDLELLEIEASTDKDHYVCGFFNEYVPKIPELKTANKKTYKNDLFDNSKSLRAQYVEQFPKDANVTPKKSFKVACVGNIDSDAKLDIWTIDDNKMMVNVQSDLPE